LMAWTIYLTTIPKEQADFTKNTHYCLIKNIITILRCAAAFNSFL